MKKLIRICAIGTFSALLYMGIEILFRGYTHWTMGLLAFCVGIILTFLNDQLFEYDTKFEIQVLTGTIISTIFELIFGLIFNSNFTIWDYRSLPGTFAFSQLNIIFCGVWMLICIFGLPLLDYLQYKLGLGPEPYYCFFATGDQRFYLIKRRK